MRFKKISSFSSNSSAQEFDYLDGVIYGLDYAQNPEIKSAIRQFKYRYTQDLADYFSEILEGKLGELGMLKKSDFVLIPVPLHRRRIWERGFNQAELIAKDIHWRVPDKSEVLDLLKRSRYTGQQAKLNRAGRLQNLEGAFELVGDMSALDGKVCFLVDDVCTTGTTLDECARILKEAGIKKVYGLVVARAFK